MRWPEHWSRWFSGSHPQRRLRSVGLLLPLLSAGCFSTGEGIEPPAERIYFPVGLALDAEARHLVVLNSDFDLQYKAGTLQVLNLGDPDASRPSEGLRRFIPKPCLSDSDCEGGVEPESCDSSSGFCTAQEGPFAGRPCGALEEHSIREQLIYPGPCGTLDPVHPPVGESLISSAVEIGAFATDVIYRERPSEVGEAGAPGRIFFPVRGDATLHWADLDERGQVECGQAENGGACDARHRVGDSGDHANSRDISMAPEPFALDATRDGRALVVTQQTTNNVTLFSHDWSSEGPELDYDLGGLGNRPVGVAAVPPPASATERLALFGDQDTPNYGFLVTFRLSAQVSLLRYIPESQAAPLRPYLAFAGSTGLPATADGEDSRGIAVDDRERRAAEERCFAEHAVECEGDDAACRAEQESLLECLDEAAAIGLDVYVANRSPEVLLIGRTRPAPNALSSTELPVFSDTLPLPLGPSRVVVGDVIVRGDESSGLVRERRVFVVCFDSRRIVVYDPKRRSVDMEIVTGRGPHAIAVDGEHGLLFVGHFTDSYVGVVSLDRRFPRTYGTMVGTIGSPTPPRASK